MANPQNTGTFDYWLDDRTTFATLRPKSSNTGTFDQWLDDRTTFADYVAAPAAAAATGRPIQSRHLYIWTKRK